MNLEEIRTYCLKLPNATEDIKWDSDLCFCINDKMFCVVELNSEPLSLSVKVGAKIYDSIIDGPHYKPAKYLARYNWVSLTDATAIRQRELESLISNSYKLISQK